MPDMDHRSSTQKTNDDPVLLTRASFLGFDHGSIKRLSGWRPNHSVPKEHSSYTRAFVQRISEQEIKERLEQFHSAIKDAFAYKRKQIETSTGPGFASCKTPDFDLEISVAIDPEDASRYMETVSVFGIHDHRILESDAFANVYDRKFSEVHFEYSRPFDMHAVIDAIEECNEPNLRLHYPPDTSQCTIDFENEGIQIVITDNVMRFVLDGKSSIHHISQILIKGHELLVNRDYQLLPE
jgi:hypothetical protein